jgi:hypothetical protein
MATGIKSHRPFDEHPARHLTHQPRIEIRIGPRMYRQNDGVPPVVRKMLYQAQRPLKTAAALARREMIGNEKR